MRTIMNDPGARLVAGGVVAHRYPSFPVIFVLKLEDEDAAKAAAKNLVGFGEAEDAEADGVLVRARVPINDFDQADLMGQLLSSAFHGSEYVGWELAYVDRKARGYEA